MNGYPNDSERGKKKTSQKKSIVDLTPLKVNFCQKIKTETETHICSKYEI